MVRFYDFLPRYRDPSDGPPRFRNVDFEVPKVIQHVSDVISHLEDGRLDEQHKTYFLTVALPKIVQRLKAHRALTEAGVLRIHSFLRIVITVVIKYLKENHIQLVDLLVSILTPDAALYGGKPMPHRLHFIPEPSFFAVPRRRRRLIIATPSNVHRLRLSDSARRGKTPKGKTPLGDLETPDEFAFQDYHKEVDKVAALEQQDDELTVSQIEGSSDDSDHDNVPLPSDDTDSDTEEDVGAGVPTKKLSLAASLDNAEMESAPYSVGMHRPVPGSEWVVDSINYFGYHGGFSAIVKHLVSSDCPLPYAAVWLHFIAHLTEEGYIASQRIQKFVMALELHFLPRLGRLDAQDLRLAKKDDVDLILKNMGTIFRSFNVHTREIARALEPWLLSALKQFLLLAPIDKRVNALQQFISIVESAQTYEQHMRMTGRMSVVDPDFADGGYVSGLHQRTGSVKFLTTAELAQWLRDSKVIEALFGEHRHSQVVSKSLPLVRFLVTTTFLQGEAQTSYLSSTAVDAIWQCATKTTESTVADDTFSLLTQISPILNSGSVDYLVAVASTQITTAPDNRSLQFCSHLARVARDSNHRLRMLDAMWSVCIRDTVEVEKSTFAATQLVDALKSDACARFRKNALFRTVQAAQPKSFASRSIAMRVADGIFKIVPLNPSVIDLPSSPRTESIAELVSSLQQELNVISMLMNEFQEWKEACKIAVAAAPDLFMASSVIVGRLPFMEELKARLDLLFTLLSHSQRISPEFRPLVTVAPTQLWDIIVDGALFAEERNEAFVWFQCARIVGPSGLCPVNTQVAHHLFEQKIIKLDHSSEPISNMNFFRCYQKYFLDINAALGKITLPAGAPSNAPPSDLVVLAPLGELQGSSVFWTLAIESPDAAVVDAALDLLLKLTEKSVVAPASGFTKWSVRETYIQQCLRHLADAVNAVVKAGKVFTDLSRRRVSRCLKLLLGLLDAVEPAVNSEPTKTRAAPVKLRIKVILDVANLAPLAFFVDGDMNTPFKAIYQRVLMNMQPEMEKHNVQASDLLLVDPLHPGVTLDLQGDDEAFTLKSLSEIGLEDGQKLLFRRGTATKGRETSYRLRSNISEMLNQKPPLDAAQKAQEVVEFSGLSTDMALFALRKHRWDVHTTVDVLMDDSRRSAIIAEARRSGVSEQTSASEGQKSAARSLGLEEYLKIMSARTRLLLSASSDESLTSSVDEAMQKHLQLVNPDLSMPSLILSRQSSSFDLLFSVISVDDAEISPIAWKLLWRLPVSASVKTGLLAGIAGGDVSDDPPDWSRLLPDSSNTTHELHYSLSLIDQIVFPLDPTQVIQKRVEWAHWFLGSAGATRLLEIFLDLVPGVKSDTSLLLLKLAEFFWSSCLYSEGVQTTEGVQDEFTSFVRNISSPDLTLALTPEVCGKAIDSIMRYLDTVSANEDGHNVVYYALRLLILVTSQSTGAAKAMIEEKIDSLGAFLLKLLSFHNDTASLSCARIRAQAAARVAELCRSSHAMRQFFVKRLVSMSESALAQPSGAGPVDGVFDLNIRLTKDLFKEKGLEASESLRDLLKALAVGVIKRPVVEVGAGSVPDQTLGGSLQLLATLVKYWPVQVPDDIGGVSLINAVFNDCLFAEKTSRVSFPKCKTPPSRAAAFKLLRALSKNSPTSHLISLVKSLTLHQHKTFDGAVVGQWDISTAEEERASSGYVGLANLGATCYANSLLQQWFMMKGFRQDLLRAPVVLSDTKSFLTAGSIEENIVFQLQRIFGFLQESEKAFYNPKDFCSTYRDLAGQPMNVSQQQDVNEFFNIVCQRLEEQLKGTSHAGLLSRYFAGAVSNEFRCIDPAFPYSSEREEEFYAIAVDIKHKKTLHEALDLFVKPERLEGDNRINVEQYGRKLDAERISSIKKLSSTVIFHLKRFEYDVGYNRRNKVNDKFEFPMEINLKPWTREGVAESQGRKAEAAGFEAEALKDTGLTSDEFYDYVLTGILVHSGSADSGHYYSIVRDGDRRWLQFNDRVVSEFDPKLIPAESFGGTQIQSRWDSIQKKSIKKEVPVERSAYMLFYDRRVQKQEPIAVATPAQVTLPATTPDVPAVAAFTPDSDSRIPAATTTAGVVDALLLAFKQASPDAPALAVEMSSSAAASSAGGSGDPSDSSVKPPKPVSPTWETVQGVPKPIFDAIWTDNSKFLRDRQLYDPLYFDFVLSLLSEMETRLKSLGKPVAFDPEMLAKAYVSDNAADEQFIDIMLIKFAVRLLVEVILRNKQASCVPWWVSLLRRIFSVHHVAAVWFIDYVRRNGILKDALLVCPREKTRIEFADLCVAALRTSTEARLAYRPSMPFRKPNTKEVSWEISGAVEDAAQTLALSCWELFDESRPHWKRFKQFFGLIRDFALLGRNNREFLIKQNVFQKYTDYFMGNGIYGAVQIMDDQNLPDLVEFIDTLAVLYRGSRTEASPDAPPSPYRLTDDLTDRIPPTSCFALFESKFFHIVLDMQYNVQSITELVKHASWNNPERSEPILEEALRTLQQGQTHRLPGYEYQLAGLLSISDSLQDKRIRRALTSFKFSGSSKGRGMMAHVMEMHSRNSKDPNSADIARFITVLARDIPAVFRYICRRQSDLEWLREFLESKVDELLNQRFALAHSNFRLTEELLVQDARERQKDLFPKMVGYVPNAQVVTRDPNKNASQLDFLRNEATYASLVFVHWCCLQAEEGVGQGASPAGADDQVFKLVDQVDKLQQQVKALEKDKASLIEALRHCLETTGAKLPGDLHYKVASFLPAPVISPRVPGNGRWPDENQQLIVHPNAAAQNLVPGQPGWVAPNLSDLELKNLGDAAATVAAATQPGVGPHARATAPDPDVEMDDINLGRGHGRDSDEETEPGADQDDDWPSRDNFNGFGPHAPPGGGDYWRGGPFPNNRTEPHPPPNLAERLESLRNIFGDQYDESILTEALRANGWDIEVTAETMFDPMRMDRYIADAKRRGEQPTQPPYAGGRLNNSDDDLVK